MPARAPTFLGLDFKNFGFLPRGEVFKVGAVLRCRARTRETREGEGVTGRSTSALAATREHLLAMRPHLALASPPKKRAPCFQSVLKI